MSRKRIYELAKEWGVETRQVLAHLEAQDVLGKKAQSTLTDSEAENETPGTPTAYVEQKDPEFAPGE